MVKYYLDIAREIWGEVDLPSKLEDKLHKINSLCEQANGVLASRQTISVIIQNFKEDNGYE